MMSWYSLVCVRLNSLLNKFFIIFKSKKTKTFLKKNALFFLSIIGVVQWMRHKNRHNVSVLMLHGVMEDQPQNLWKPLRPQITPSELKRSLTILSRYYQFVNIDQAIDIIKGNAPEIKYPLLITFDDGYRNNLDYALPICKEFGIKPLLCLTTGNVDSQLPFWFDRLDYALQQNMGGVIDIDFAGKSYKFNAGSRHILKKSYKKFRDTIKQKFDDDIDMTKLLNGLSDILEARSGRALRDICEKDAWSAIVKWDELKKEVTLGNINIASHTIDHVRLGCLSTSEIIYQINESKNRIEKELEIACNIFCYPNGDYNQLVVNFLKEAGYKAAFTTDVGLCRRNDEMMTLKRYSFPVGKSETELLFILNR